MSNLRYVPSVMLGEIKGRGGFAQQRVVQVEAIPPQSRTEGDAPIVQGMTLVKVHLESGTIRYFGTSNAYIDATLRMVMEINPRDEVLSRWKRIRTDSGPGLIIEISSESASPCLMDGREVSDDPVISEALADCRRSGDCQPACEYVRDVIGVEFRIVALNAEGRHENRIATAEEKAQVAREIYFDSESDFEDESTAEMYLIWQAADEAGQERD